MTEEFKKAAKVEWAVVIIISFVAFVIYRYIDLNTLTVWSLNLLDCIYDGNVSGFYEYSALNLQNIHHTHASCDIIFILPWSLWNIPVWIAQRFFGVLVMQSVFSVLWSKLYLVLWLIITAKYAKKICLKLEIDGKRANLVFFLTISSPFIFTEVYYAGNSNIIAIALSCIAVYKVLNNNRTMFMLFSALTIMQKPFFLFAFLAVVLIVEKNILKIISSVLICFLPVVFSRLVFSGFPLYAESMSDPFFDRTLEAMFEVGFLSQFGLVSLFILSLCVLYYICYTKKIETDKQREYFIIYAITAAFLICRVLSYDVFYRPVFLVPFIYILITLSPDKEKAGLILLGIVSFLITIFFATVPTILTLPHVIYSTDNMQNTVLSFFAPNTTGPVSYVGQLVYAVLPMQYEPLLTAVIVFCLFWFVFAYYPGSKIPVPYKGEKPARWIVWLNAYQAAPIVIASVYLFFK